MNKLLLTLLVLASASALHAEPRLDGAGASIPRNLISGGGGLSSGGGITLDGAVGEAVISTSGLTGAASSYAGLMNEIAQPGSVISLVSVTQDTGTIALSWTAPALDGLNGAFGEVFSGYYRIDTSSDPAIAAAFVPTTMLAGITTEISTSNVVPGSAQSYTLTGLLPNTTYYSRIYLADARKYFAETSAQDADSTLAHLPVSPVFSGVFQTSVTISWTVPVGQAEGYLINASSTDFGALTPGGVVVSSQTPNGVELTLTVTGLFPNATYYFNVGSLNWASNVNFNTVMSTLTLPGGVLPIQNLNLAAGSLGRMVTFTWTNPAFPSPAGVTVVVSTNPIVFTPTNGTPYALGTVLPDGSVVKSSAPTPSASFVDTNLTLDVTTYFAFFSRNLSNSYSVAVSTYVILDLPPMAPAGLTGPLTMGGAYVNLGWWHVTSNLDGSSFVNPFAPSPWELNGYNIYRSTGIIFANWVYIGSAPATSTVWLASVPVVGGLYYYKVVSVDAYNSALTDAAMVIDTLGNVFAVDGDQVTRLEIPAGVAGLLQPTGNPSGRPLLVRADERPQDLVGNVIKSVSFDPVSAPANQPVLVPAPSAPTLDVAMHYDTVGGVVVPSALGPMALHPAAVAVNASNAPTALSAYYVNGTNAAKIFGQVDPFGQTVGVQAPYLGNYQIRAVGQTQSFSFDISGISNKAITPNGDGVNDTVVFTFDNPLDSAVSGKIYDMRGRLVANLVPGPVAGASLVWDGKANGAAVPRGVYVYQISAEGKNFSGTVVVIR